MMPAMWFSRHAPTQEQLAEIKQLGYELSQESIRKGMDLGGRNLTEEYEVADLEGEIGLLQEEGKTTLFGVIPTPLRGVLYCYRRLVIFESWNVKRSLDGGLTASFQHKCWVRTL